MNKQEFGLITVYLHECYGIEFTQQKNKIWYDVLQDIDFELAKMAVKKIVETETNSFNVNPAMVRKMCSEMGIPEGYGVGQTTSKVMGMLSAYGNNRCVEALEQLKSENEIAWKVARQIGWYNMCYGDTQKVKESFERQYREQLKEHMSKNALSPKTRAMIDGSNIPAIEG